MVLFGEINGERLVQKLQAPMEVNTKPVFCRQMERRTIHGEERNRSDESHQQSLKYTKCTMDAFPQLNIMCFK